MVDKTSVCVCVSVRGHNSSVTRPILMIFGHDMRIPGTPGPFWNWEKNFTITPLTGVVTPQMAPIICPQR